MEGRYRGRDQDTISFLRQYVPDLVVLALWTFFANQEHQAEQGIYRNRHKVLGDHLLKLKWDVAGERRNGLVRHTTTPSHCLSRRPRKVRPREILTLEIFLS